MGPPERDWKNNSAKRERVHMRVTADSFQSGDEDSCVGEALTHKQALTDAPSGERRLNATGG